MRPLSAAQIADRVRSGRLDPRAVRENVGRAAARLNPRLNAFLHLEDPEAADGGDGPGRRGILCGVPVAVKDLIDQAGRITTAGSAFHRGRPRVSAPAITRLEAEGATITGRTNLHEFAFGFSSENPWFGPVRNPWDPALSAGGSSGGSAAAVAAGIVPAALGTDTGGSVRTPAALCGIVGLKTTNGLIPRDGVFPLAPSLDTVGPMTRTVGDARLLYRALAPSDGSDPPPGPALAGIRVAVPMTWLETIPRSRTVRRGFETFCDDLTGLGAEVRRVTAPELVPDRNIFTIVGTEAVRIHRRWLTQGLPYGGDVAERLRTAAAATPEELRTALARRETMRARARELFADYHLLATPTVGHPRKTIGLDDMDIGGTPVFYRTPLSGYTALVNHLGCPALALPLTAPGTPPPSVQLIAPWRQEEQLLETGIALEKAGLVGYRPPPLSAGA